MTDLHEDHVNVVLGIEEWDALSPIIQRSMAAQAAAIIRNMTNKAGHLEKRIERLSSERDAATERAERYREALQSIYEGEPNPRIIASDAMFENDVAALAPRTGEGEDVKEERICTCGAGHGSLEGHMDWCDWQTFARTGEGE